MRKRPTKPAEIFLRGGLAGIGHAVKNPDTVNLDQAALLMCDWLTNYATARNASDTAGHIYNFMQDMELQH